MDALPYLAPSGASCGCRFGCRFSDFFPYAHGTICFAPPANTTSSIAEVKRSRDMFILHRNSGDLDWLLISLFITMFFHHLQA